MRFVSSPVHVSRRVVVASVMVVEVNVESSFRASSFASVTPKFPKEDSEFHFCHISAIDSRRSIVHILPLRLDIWGTDI